MKDLFNIGDFALADDALAQNALVDVKINLVYPDLKQFLEFKPKKRIKKIDAVFHENLHRLIVMDLFDEFTVNQPGNRPLSVDAKLKLSALSQLGHLDYVTVHIESIVGAEKISKAQQDHSDQFYCVKMTAVIEFEGARLKKQKIEKRLILIKAKSPEEAYKKIEAQNRDYSQPYLNSSGRMVRWRIDSLDDCYVTDVFDASEFNSPEGIEVYSRLSSRKAKDNVVWDGKV